MDLSVFKEASSAVAKVMKDYQPIVRLAEELAEVQAKLEEVGELGAAKARASAELAQVLAAKQQAEKALTDLKQEQAKTQSALDRIKAALLSVKL